MDRKRGRLNLRDLSGVILLVVLLLSGMLSSWYMSVQHRQISKTLEDCSWMALSGQWSNARETVMTARTDWEKSRNLRAVLADHTPIEEIDDLFEELSIYGAAGERTEFARVCASLSRRMEAMGGAHQLTWWNLL